MTYLLHDILNWLNGNTVVLCLCKVITLKGRFIQYPTIVKYSKVQISIQKYLIKTFYVFSSLQTRVHTSTLKY